MKEGCYGFPCVEDPHDFTPDAECCTPEEIAFWENSKKRWDVGERDEVFLYITPKIFLRFGVQKHLAMSGVGVKIGTAKEARLVLASLTRWAESMKRELEAGQ